MPSSFVLPLCSRFLKNTVLPLCWALSLHFTCLNTTHPSILSYPFSRFQHTLHFFRENGSNLCHVERQISVDFFHSSWAQTSKQRTCFSNKQTWMLEIVFPQQDSETHLCGDVWGSKVLSLPSLMTFQNYEASPSALEETNSPEYLPWIDGKMCSLVRVSLLQSKLPASLRYT